MYTEILDVKVFETQCEFLRVMQANRDFFWYGDTLVREETKELSEAFQAHPMDMEHLFKEIGDVIYVVAGVYNLTPPNPQSILTEDQYKELQSVVQESMRLMSEVSQDLKIPPFLMEMAFYEVHRSNMSKLDENGEPVRRESDGKILKGPNYSPADMSKTVEAWNTLQTEIQNQEQQ